MSKVHWKNDANGNFATAADWTGGAVPGASDDAILDAAGSTPFTVMSAVSETVNSIQTASTATLAITGGAFTATNGTGAGANAGTISLTGNLASLTMAGKIVNSGLISLGATGASGVKLLVGSAGATLSGGGSVTLADNRYSSATLIGSASGATTLTNADNTISGAGRIGNGTQLTLVNQAGGILDASGDNPLYVSTGGKPITNAGLIESTGTAFSGGLVISSTTVANSGTIAALVSGGGGIVLGGATVNDASGGQFLVGAGAYLGLANGTIAGGNLTIGAGASVYASSGANAINVTSFTNQGAVTLGGTSTSLSLQDTAISNTGSISEVGNNLSLTLGGAVANSGAISLDASGGSGVSLLVGSGGATLSGGGSVTLADNKYSAATLLESASGATTLTNVDNTISGAGRIGNGTLLTLVNDASGVIDANGAHALYINTGGKPITNAGLIESTTTSFNSGLVINNTTIANSGTIQALVSGGGGINLQNATVNDVSGGQFLVGAGAYIGLLMGTITGGNLSIGVGASVYASSGANAINVTSFTNQGAVTLGGTSTSLSLQDTAISNTGSISEVGNNLSLTLGGAVANSGAISLDATGSSGVKLLVGSAGATLSGGGSVTLADNKYSAATLLESASGATTLTNVDDTISGAGRIGNGTLLTLVNDASGVIDANGAHALYINTGGKPITNAGLIESTATTSSGRLFITNTTVTNSGMIEALVSADSGIALQSTTVNDVAGGQFLVGAGAYVLQQNSTITGANLNLGTGAYLYTNSGANSINVTSFDNQGTVTLAGTSVSLSIQGGTITNTGSISEVGNNLSLTLSGAVADSGAISLDATGSSGVKLLVGSAGATLSGGGSVTLADNKYSAATLLESASGATTLTNVDNTISGAGRIGNGTLLTLVNDASGVIDANGAHALYINTGGKPITNAGLIESTTTSFNSGLVINNTTVANSGTIQALVSGGGGINLQNATVNDVSGGQFLVGAGAYIGLLMGTITGGNLSIGVGASVYASSGANAINVTSFTNQGAVTLGGTSTSLSLQDTAISNTGSISEVGNNLSLTLGGAVANSGAISLDATGSSGVKLLVGSAGATLSGGGSVTLADNKYSAATLLESASGVTTLTNVDNTISGAGRIGNGTLLTLVNDASGVIDANGAHALYINIGGKPITNAGLIESTGKGGLAISSGTVSNGGTLLASGASTLAFSGGALANLSGTTLSGGAFVASGGGTLELANNSTITTLNAFVDLDGAGSAIQSLNTSTSKQVALEATLTTIASGGVLEILNARNYAGGTKLANGGTLVLGGGTIGSKGLTNTGTLSGFGDLATTFTNIGAVSAASGQTLGLVGGSLTNLSGGTLTAGIYSVGAGGALQLANDTSISILNATVALNGAGSMVQGLNSSTSSEVTLEWSLVAIGGQGLLQILGGRDYTSANAIAIAGAIQLGGGTLTTGTLTDSAGSSLTGFGAVASAFTDSGAVTSSGGALAFTGAGDQFNAALTGTEIDFAGGADALNTASSLAASTIGLSGGAAVTLNANQSFNGAWNQGAASVALNGNTLTLSGTSTFNAGAAISGPGTLSLVGDTASTNSTLSFGGTFAEDASSNLSIASGQSLFLSGATLNGTVGGAGTLALGGGSASLGAGALISVANVTLTGETVTIGGNLAYAGTFSEDAASSIAIGTTDALSLNGAANLAGAVTGGGTLGIGGALTLGDDLAFGGTFVEASGASITLGSTALTLSGTDTFGGAVSGTGILAFDGGTQAINAGANFTQAGWSVTGGAAVTVNTALTYAGGFSEDSASSITIASGDSLSLNGAFSLAGAISGSGTLGVGGALTLGGNLAFVGTFVEASGGAIALGSNTLTLTGPGSTLAGAVTGAGTLAFAGGSQAVNAGASIGSAAWSLSGGDATTLNTSLAYAGSFSEDATSSVSITGGDSLTLSNATLARAIRGAGALAFSGGMQAINTGATISTAAWSLAGGASASINEALAFAGTFSEDAASTLAIGASDSLTLNGTSSLAGAVTGGGTLGVGGALTLGGNLAFAGTLIEASGASIALGANTLTLSGTDTFAGAVGGAGTLTFTAGAQAINAGAAITAAAWSVSAGATSVNGNLAFAGSFSEGAATITIASGNAFTLSGASSFAAGAVVNGAGMMNLANATITGLTIGGTATLNDTGTVVQTGAVTIGDASSSSAHLTIAKGATWQLDGNVGLAEGHSKTSGVTISGTLIKTAGTGTSVVALKTADSGLIEVASGLLDFTQAISGKGALKIDAGATLELDNTVARTITATFNGAGATLDLKKASKMAGAIAGFTAGNTIDLLKTAATSATINGSDQLVITNGSTTVATLQLAGNYVGQSFNLASDGHGGTAITVSGGGASAPFVAAMAGLGGGADGTAYSWAAIHRSPPSLVALPH